MAKKKLLTLDNLYNFYLNQNKTCKFSAKESGYQVSVQIPTKFEISDETYDDTLLFCTVKLMHSGENRNHSCVTDEALYKAGKNLAYKPILANFMEYIDEETGETLKDFTAHDMELNDDGTITYYEKQIGCFTADAPYYEIEKETGHNFLYGKCAIPIEYSDAYSIIKRKNGTKISVELLINEMKYNVQSKVLELTDVIIQGATCLGKNPNTLQDVEEGMLNARLDIADFSAENNSIKFNKDKKLIDLLDKLNNTLSNFNNNNSKKGGDVEKMSILEELLTKYSKTIEDITFEYENLSDEELSAKFEEVFGKCGDGKKKKCEEDPDDKSDDDVMEPDDDLDDINEPDDSDDDLEEPDDYSKEDNVCGSGKKKKCEEDDSVKDDNACNPDKKKKCEEDDEDSASKEDNACGDSKKKKNSVEYSVAFGEKIRKFEVSLDEKIDALYRLVNETYADADNTWYGIKVYEKHVVMIDWCSNKCYKQSYTFEDDVCSLAGDRVEVFAEYVTADEQKELESMRANYSSISAKLAQYEEAEEIADKMNVFSDEAYSNYLDTDEFKALMGKDVVKKFTKEELVEKADAALGKLVKTTKTFSVVTDKKEEKKEAPSFFAFGRIEQDTSFLDGLLKK